MTNINKYLKKVHKKVHYLSRRNKYTIGLYTGQNFDLTKAWYIRWSFRNPETLKLERQKNFKLGVNYYETKQERLSALKVHKKNLEHLLDNGYSPLELADIIEISENEYTPNEALNFALDLKKSTVSPTTYAHYYYESEKLKDYLRKIRLLNLNIKHLNKRVITNYLNYVLKSSTARTRNNARSNLSALFTVLKDNFILDRNFITDIPKLKTDSKTDRTLSNKLIIDIAEYLKQTDQTLLLYIKFVAYNFLRPIEVNRLTIGNIDLKEKRLYFKSKTKSLKTKLIPEIILKDLLKMNLDKYDNDCYLFTPNNIPDLWNTSDTNKRNYYSKRFKKVKQKFNLGANYGIYSFRHSFITNLFRTYRKTLSFNATIDILMPITGHESKQGLINYIHKIDADIPKDWSKYIEVIL